MKIDQDLLQKLQELSYLEISQDKEEILKQLSDIVEFVENLNELQTDKIDAMFSSIKDGCRLREDKVIKKETSKDILKNAPLSEENFFIVPKIIE